MTATSAVLMTGRNVDTVGGRPGGLSCPRKRRVLEIPRRGKEIHAALVRAKGNAATVARKLRIGRSAVTRALKNYHKAG
jgi:hypothetical protein